MKKTIISMAAAALCASAISTQAFAADIAEDTSIFAENPEEFVATIKGWPEDNTFLDSKTIMPQYYADIRDYIKTGELNISEVDSNGYYQYVSNLVNSNGDFLGVVFSVGTAKDELRASSFFSEYSEDPMINEKHKQCSSVDFRLYSEEVKDLMLANGISPDVKDVKLLFLEGAGMAYYISSGTDEVLVRARGIDMIDWHADSEVVVLNEQFRQKAAATQEEKDKAYEDFKDKYGEDTYGAGDGANPDTGSNTAALAAELGLASAMIIGGMIVSRKRKNER